MKPEQTKEKVLAFNGMQRWYHKHIIHFMFFFIITGLPVLSHSFSWLGYLFAWPYDFINGTEGVVLADGLNVARMLHRVFAFLFVFSSIPFVIYMLKHIKEWHIWPEKSWHPKTMLKGAQEVIYTYSTFKHGQVGKYNMAQKLMAWAIIALVVLITVSGGVLMFRDSFSLGVQAFFRMVHAVSFIGLMILMICHIYFAVFPINRAGLKSMFGDGMLSKEHIKHHHPLWYQKLTTKDEPKAAQDEGDVSQADSHKAK